MATAAVGVVALALYMTVLSAPDLREVEEFQQRFSTLALGDSKHRVIEVLGKPDADDSDFHVGQFEGYEDDYERARESDSVDSSFWYRRLDFVFAVGFDEDEKVTLLIEFGGPDF